MFKFLHFADVHLGMENYGKIDKKTGLHSRLSDFLRCFDFLCEWAIKNKVDFALFAGDAYKTRDPSPTYQREFAKRIKKLAANNIFVFLLVGNHDLPNAIGKANTLDIYSTLEIENVYVARQPEVIRLVKINHHWQVAKSEQISLQPVTQNQIQIVALPWIPRTWLLPPEEYQKKEIYESYKIMSNKLIEKVQNLAQMVNKNLPAIFLGHLTLAGAQFSSEQKAYLGQDIVLPKEVLERGPWQYVALGHLHKYQVLAKNPPIIYSGSIERVDFGEEKEEKGFIAGEIYSDKKNKFWADYKFIPLPARKFLTLFCEVNAQEDPTKKILTQIRNSSIDGAVVKIKVKIPEEKEGELQEREIQENMKSAYYFVGIQKEIIKKERRHTFENIESLSILEALEKYWQSKNIELERIKELKAYAQKLISEENS